MSRRRLRATRPRVVGEPPRNRRIGPDLTCGSPQARSRSAESPPPRARFEAGGGLARSARAVGPAGEQPIGIRGPSELCRGDRRKAVKQIPRGCPASAPLARLRLRVAKCLALAEKVNSAGHNLVERGAAANACSIDSRSCRRRASSAAARAAHAPRSSPAIFFQRRESSCSARAPCPPASLAAIRPTRT